MKAAWGAVVVAARGVSGGGGGWRVAGGGASGRVDARRGCVLVGGAGASFPYIGAEGDEVGHCDGAGKPRFLRLCPEGDR